MKDDRGVIRLDNATVALEHVARVAIHGYMVEILGPGISCLGKRDYTPRTQDGLDLRHDLCAAAKATAQARYEEWSERLAEYRAGKSSAPAPLVKLPNGGAVEAGIIAGITRPGRLLTQVHLRSKNDPAPSFELTQEEHDALVAAWTLARGGELPPGRDRMEAHWGVEATAEVRRAQAARDEELRLRLNAETAEQHLRLERDGLLDQVAALKAEIADLKAAIEEHKARAEEEGFAALEADGAE